MFSTTEIAAKTLTLIKLKVEAGLGGGINTTEMHRFYIKLTAVLFSLMLVLWCSC